MGSKGVALVVAVIGVIALAAAGVYLYRHQGADAFRRGQGGDRREAGCGAGETG